MGAPIAFVIAAMVMLIFAFGFLATTPYVEKAGVFTLT